MSVTLIKMLNIIKMLIHQAGNFLGILFAEEREAIGRMSCQEISGKVGKQIE